MTELYNSHMQRHPLGWRDLFRRHRMPTALDLARTALEDCQRERLHHTNEAEHHKAMRDMLVKREIRLRGDIARLGGGTPE